MSKFIVNNIELELDLLDADVLENYQHKIAAFGKEVNAPGKYDGMTEPEAMRLQCRMLDKLFDDLFGAGISEKCFGVNSKLGIRMAAYGELCTMARASMDEVNSITGKYGAARIQNREQRRHGGQKPVHHYKKGN